MNDRDQFDLDLQTWQKETAKTSHYLAIVCAVLIAFCALSLGYIVIALIITIIGG